MSLGKLAAGISLAGSGSENPRMCLRKRAKIESRAVLTTDLYWRTGKGYGGFQALTHKTASAHL